MLCLAFSYVKAQTILINSNVISVHEDVTFPLWLDSMSTIEIVGSDVDKAFEAMKHSATRDKLDNTLFDCLKIEKSPVVKIYKNWFSIDICIFPCSIIFS